MGENINKSKFKLRSTQLLHLNNNANIGELYDTMYSTGKLNDFNDILDLEFDTK